MVRTVLSAVGAHPESIVAVVVERETRRLWGAPPTVPNVPPT
jgi:hypothetical protein